MRDFELFAKIYIKNIIEVSLSRVNLFRTSISLLLSKKKLSWDDFIDSRLFDRTIMLKNRHNILEFILKVNPESIILKSADGIYHIHLASLIGDIQSIFQIIKYCPHSINFKTENGLLPIHFSVLGEHLEVSRYLANLKPCSLVVRSKAGYLPEDIASFKNNKTFELILRSMRLNFEKSNIIGSKSIKNIYTLPPKSSNIHPKKPSTLCNKSFNSPRKSLDYLKTKSHIKVSMESEFHENFTSAMSLYDLNNLLYKNVSYADYNDLITFTSKTLNEFNFANNHDLISENQNKIVNHFLGLILEENKKSNYFWSKLEGNFDPFFDISQVELSKPIEAKEMIHDQLEIVHLNDSSDCLELAFFDSEIETFVNESITPRLLKKNDGKILQNKSRPKKNKSISLNSSPKTKKFSTSPLSDNIAKSKQRDLVPDSFYISNSCKYSSPFSDSIESNAQQISYASKNKGKTKKNISNLTNQHDSPPDSNDTEEFETKIIQVRKIVGVKDHQLEEHVNSKDIQSNLQLMVNDKYLEKMKRYFDLRAKRNSQKFHKKKKTINFRRLLSENKKIKSNSRQTYETFVPTLNDNSILKVEKRNLLEKNKLLSATQTNDESPDLIHSSPPKKQNIFIELGGFTAQPDFALITESILTENETQDVSKYLKFTHSFDFSNPSFESSNISLEEKSLNFKNSHNHHPFFPTPPDSPFDFNKSGLHKK